MSKLKQAIIDDFLNEVPNNDFLIKQQQVVEAGQKLKKTLNKKQMELFLKYEEEQGELFLINSVAAIVHTYNFLKENENNENNEKIS